MDRRPPSLALAAATLLGAAACTSSKPDDVPASWAAAVAKARSAVASMTLDEKLALVEGQAKLPGDAQLSAGYVPPVTVSRTGLAIPGQYICDGPNGVGDANTGVTQFPVTIALAATWDVDLARAYGDAVGAEWAGKGCVYGMGPGVNIVRVPYGGRTAEYLGEDPHLAGEIGAAEVRGIQGQHVVSVVKHLAANDQETARQLVDVAVSERALRELHLPAFERIVTQGGVGSVMCSYNRLGGTYACENPRLLTDILRREWRFQGVTMSDWAATHGTAGSVAAGLDMEMPGTSQGPGWPLHYSAENLKSALAAGRITPGQLDAMVLHVLTAMYQVGSLDAFPRAPAAVVTSDDHRALARAVSEAGAVLLKNAGPVLPLDASDAALRIAVIGAAAHDLPQSTMRGSGEVFASHVVTPLAGIAARAAGTVTYHVGSLATGALEPLTADAPGFVARYTDAAGQPLDAVSGALSPDVSHGPDDPFGLYAYAHRWPEAPVTVGGVTGTLASGDVQRWKASFTGSVTIATPATYDFNLTGDAGAALYVDGRLVGEIAAPWFEQSATFQAALAAGTHLVELRFDTAGWTWIGETPAISVGWNPSGSHVEEAVAAAAAADVAIVVVSDREQEGDDHPASLPGDQDELVTRVASAAKKTIVVLQTGSALVLPWADGVDAIVESWYGGEEMGSALAGVLFGDVNPSGHTAVTWPVSMAQWYAQDASQYPGAGPDRGHPVERYDEGVLVGYRWFDQMQRAPLFPFGHGLSYTEFAYGPLGLSAASGDGSSLQATVQVWNAGARSGSEVAQLYLAFPRAAGEPPRRLEGFRKVALQPGDSATVTFDLDRRAFSYWDEAAGGWVVPAGAFQVLVGRSSRDVRAAATYVVSTR